MIITKNCQILFKSRIKRSINIIDNMQIKNQIIILIAKIYKITKNSLIKKFKRKNNPRKNDKKNQKNKINRLVVNRLI